MVLGSIFNLKPAGFATDLRWELRELEALRPPPGFGTENPEDGAAVRRGRKMSEEQVLGDQGFSLGNMSLGLRWEMHVDTGGAASRAGLDCWLSMPCNKFPETQ